MIILLLVTTKYLSMYVSKHDVLTWQSVSDVIHKKTEDEGTKDT